MTYTYRETFQSPYDNCGKVRCADLNGLPFTVDAVYEHETERMAQECAPMFDITIEGVQYEAWREILAE